MMWATAPASMARRRPRNERGAMLAFVAVVMVGVMGALAMALSVGAANRQRRIAQTAADAAAITGGIQLNRAKVSAAVVAAARNSAIANGFAASEITVNYPPVTGARAGNDDFVEVIINKTIPTIFGSGSILRRDSVGVGARAVAGLGSIVRSCVIALGTTGNAIDINGDMTADCGILSNSGIYVKDVLDGPYAGAVTTIVGGPPGHSFAGMPPVADPFASLQLPTGADTTCTHTGLLQIDKDTAINAGVYCGGISIRKNVTATFNAGTYFIRGGGLSGGEVKATPLVGGVTIILGNGVNNDPSLFRGFVFDNSCVFDVKAPMTGAYKGIAVFVDRNAPSSGANSINQVCGQGDITGVVYVPTQEFKLANSNGKLSIFGMLVARVVNSDNGGGKYFVYLDTSGNMAIPKRASLVE